MKSISALGILLGIFMLAGVYRQSAQGSASDENKGIEKSFYRTPEEQRIDEFIKDGLALGLHDYETRSGIINALGNPKDSRIIKVRNAHYPEQIDEFHELYYDGLYIKLYHVISSDKYFVSRISLTRDQYDMRWGLGIGGSKDRVMEMLGSPKKIERGQYSYGSVIGANSWVHFHFRNDTITKIVWSYYID
jgi:hypothetical protein